MTRATVYRHLIDYGEGVHWTPPAGTAIFYAWRKFTSDNAAMRWRRIAGWNIAGNGPVVLRDAPDGGISLPNAEVSLDWESLVSLFDGFDAEVLQITTLDGEGRAVTRDAYSLPASDRNQRLHNRGAGKASSEGPVGNAPRTRGDARWARQSQYPGRHRS